MMQWQTGSTTGLVLAIVGMMIFVGAVVFGAAAWLRFTLVAGSSPVTLPAPELVLAERLAAGEIDIEDYERRLAALHSGPTPPAHHSAAQDRTELPDPARRPDAGTGIEERLEPSGDGVPAGSSA